MDLFARASVAENSSTIAAVMLLHMRQHMDEDEKRAHKARQAKASQGRAVWIHLSVDESEGKFARHAGFCFAVFDPRACGEDRRVLTTSGQ